MFMGEASTQAIGLLGKNDRQHGWVIHDVVNHVSGQPIGDGCHCLGQRFNA